MFIHLLMQYLVFQQHKPMMSKLATFRMIYSHEIPYDCQSAIPDECQVTEMSRCRYYEANGEIPARLRQFASGNFCTGRSHDVCVASSTNL